MRGVPHRPPHRRRRSRPLRSRSSCPGTRSSASSTQTGAGADRFAIGDARRRALARLDLRRLRVLPVGPREPLRAARFTGYDIDGGFAEHTVADERFCFALPDELQRRARGAAALRGAHRLSRAAAGRKMRHARALRLRCGRAHHHPGGAPPGPRRVRVHPTRRPRGSGLRPRLGAVWAGDSDAAPPVGSMRR